MSPTVSYCVSHCVSHCGPQGDDGAACGSPTALSLRRSLDEVRRSLSLDEGNRLSRQGSLGPDEGNAIRRSLDEGNRPLAIAPG